MTRFSASVLACVGLALASACDFGSDVVGVDLPRSVPLAVVPVFSVVPSEAELNALDLLRVTLRDVRDNSILEQQEIVIDSTQDRWEIQMAVDVPTGQRGWSLAIYLETELADTDGGVESVEWSGRTDAFPLQSPDRPLEFRQVDLYRGPLANLGLTRVAFTRAALDVVEGATASLQWITQGDTAGTVLYVAVENEDVVSVDPSGHLETRGIGPTKVFVFGGMVEDSVTINVTAIGLPTPAEVADEMKPPLDYATSDLFISTLHDTDQAESMRALLNDLNAALQARDGPQVIAAFEAAKTSWWSYGSGTALRYTDGPQLGVLQLTLHRVANGLHTAFP